MNFSFEIFAHAEAWIALLTLGFLEVVLGVDNVIFISIVSNKLPAEKRPRARLIGLSLALILRLILLLFISWIIHATSPLFTLNLYVVETEISIRDIILFVGGLFLMFKSTTEIHHKMEGGVKEEKEQKVSSFFSVILQIIALDVIFSFDSILTAVGLTEHVIIMMIAVVFAMIVMMIFANKISSFIQSNPTLEILALSFLILIGFMLSIEAFDQHVPKGYIYFAVAFSLAVELLNMKLRKGKDPVVLKKRIE